MHVKWSRACVVSDFTARFATVSYLQSSLNVCLLSVHRLGSLIKSDALRGVIRIHCGSDKRRTIHDPRGKFDTDTEYVVDFKKAKVQAQATLTGSRLVRKAWLSAV